jgi:hypothetical protein
MKSAIGRIYFIDRRGGVITSTKIDRHLQIKPRQLDKANDQIEQCSMGPVGWNEPLGCFGEHLRPASFEDGPPRRFDRISHPTQLLIIRDTLFAPLGYSLSKLH